MPAGIPGGFWFCPGCRLRYTRPMVKPRTRRIQKRLLGWYARHRRDLPWRTTRDPYAIWISEVMLQQTQVDRVIPKYRAWLKQFPDVQSLARAPLVKVLRAWSGLGYNRRALHLREAAKVLSQTNNREFPQTYDQLRALPGIGEYTAKALLAFAFRQPVGLIDTNVRRVIGRVEFGVAGAPTQKKLQTVVDQLVPRRAPDTWQHALMDLGATICVQRRPRCERCPLQADCRAYPAIRQTKLPNISSQARFKDSDRFWRGRIVARLLAHPHQTLPRLHQDLQQFGPLPLRRLTGLIRALKNHKIVTQRGAHIRLEQ